MREMRERRIDLGIAPCGGARWASPWGRSICALGRTPLREEAASLALCAPQVQVVGDCAAPATIVAATNAAHYAAMDVK